MPNCAVNTCRNRSQTKNYKDHGITYHIFPSNAKLKKEWIGVCGRGTNWFPTRNATICSTHFKEQCFQQFKRRILFDWAVPTLKICLILTPVSTHEQSTLVQKCAGDIEPDRTSCSEKKPKVSINVQSTPKQERDDILIPICKEENAKETFTSTPASDALTPREQKLQQIITTKDYIINRQQLQIKKIQARNRRLRKKLDKIEDSMLAEIEK